MSDDKKLVTFYEFFQPPLESGDYIVSVKQHVAGGTDDSNRFDQTFRTNTTFAVQGVRFSIPPSYVQSQFPPMGAQGEYADVLPHIVFTARTLPWQRELGVTDPNPEEGDALSYPWLALLIFDESDPAPAVAQGTLDNLLHPPTGVASYPNLTLEYGQQPTDPCNYTDVPVSLFSAIAPKSTEVRWLAHSRTITKELLAMKARGEVDTPTGETSIVVGNRLAKAGHKTSCSLVSLEDMGEYLPDRDGPPLGAQFLRLAVLASWSFSSVEQPVTFREYLTHLDHVPSTLQVPYSNGKHTPNAAVQQALEMGYTALPHHTRQAADLVSWYRGPLLPFKQGGEVKVPAASQDALTCYNPETGMLDISLSAAWQLGRLLALNDIDFATTLYNWKRSQAQAAVNSFEQQLVGEQFDIDLGGVRLHHSDLYKKLMLEAVKPTLKTMLERQKKEQK